MKMKSTLILVILMIFLSCSAKYDLPALKTVDQVDISKFMGDWYVIAAIPTLIEKQSYNAIERYELNQDGTIATTFTFNKGALDGEFKTYQPRGFVVEDSGNALWGMQFIWPIKAEYRIAYLNADYTQTIIARNARDYVWIMARTPTISEDDYQALTALIASFGYDLSKLRKVPHSDISKP